jgi:hypothetical protein
MDAMEYGYGLGWKKNGESIHTHTETRNVGKTMAYCSIFSLRF